MSDIQSIETLISSNEEDVLEVTDEEVNTVDEENQTTKIKKHKKSKKSSKKRNVVKSKSKSLTYKDIKKTIGQLREQLGDFSKYFNNVKNVAVSLVLPHLSVLTEEEEDNLFKLYKEHEQNQEELDKIVFPDTFKLKTSIVDLHIADQTINEMLSRLPLLKATVAVDEPNAMLNIINAANEVGQLNVKFSNNVSTIVQVIKNNLNILKEKLSYTDSNTKDKTLYELILRYFNITEDDQTKLVEDINQEEVIVDIEKCTIE